MFEVMRALPRNFHFGRRTVPIYRLFVAVGIYFGIVLSTIVAKRNGIPVVPWGLAVASCALAGLIGARIYHLILFRSLYRDSDRPNQLWDRSSAGGGLFGGLFAVAIISPATAAMTGVSFGVFWDYLTIALLIGAIFTRLGCFFNGCCGGRETASRFFALAWPNQRGECKRRIPVQLLEVGWLILAGGGLIYYFPRPHPPGTIALAALAWYGVGRTILEPLREEPDKVARVRINQVFAIFLTFCSVLLLVLLDRTGH